MSTNNVVYFTTTDASGFYPVALWVSDGTAGGTRLVESFPAGTTVVPLESFLTGFVFAATTAGRTIIYGTLGTALSTRQLASGAFGPLAPDALTTQIAFVNPLVEVTGLTRSRGYATVDAVNLATATAVTLLTNLQQSTAAPETVTDFTAVSGEVFFVDGNTAGVSRLYRTDGTVANTGTVWSAQTIGDLVVATNAGTGTRLFFGEGTTAVPATSHGEVLAIAATAASPTVIADFGAGTSVVDITVAANTLFMATQNADATYSLWTSDGSNETPVLVGNLGTGAPSQVLADGDGSARVFLQLGNQVLIATSGGTTVLGSFAAVGSMYVSGGTLYFGANDGTHGMQLWSSDGTEANTKQLTTVDPEGDFDPTNFSMLNGTLFFSANDGVHGTELWTWNGTTASMVSDLAPGTLGSNPALITPGLATPPGSALGLVTFTLNNTLDTGFTGVSDGTLGGTAVAFGTTPGVATIGSGGLSLSHGSADTTLMFASPYGGGSVSTTTLGGFFAAQQQDSVTFSESEVLQFTGYNATSVVVLGTFAPTISGGIATITDRVGFGSTEYFLVERGDGNDTNDVTQLWSSDGTVASTAQIANLGSVYDPGLTVYPDSSDATASAAGWGALLADDTTNAVALFTSTGAVGNFAEVTPGAIGLAGSIDNTGYFSLALAGAKYVFSVGTAGGIEAVATDGTEAGTAVLTSETPASGQTYGDFTAAGGDVYFDDGVGGALYVTNGTAAGTHMLLASGAYIAPTVPTDDDDTQAGAATTASVTQGGTTYFYFTALQGGQIGLYYADGTSVHQVMASGLAQDAFITESGGNIWFAAESGTSFVTLWETAPGAASATQVVSSAYDNTPYGPPEGIISIQAGVPLAPSDTFFLTSGNDSVAGGAGDTAIYASAGDLNAGDSIDGGAGINDLYIEGAGSFDLGVPAVLTDITQVLVDGAGDTVTLRPGTTLTVKDSGGNTIIGTADADTIDGFGLDTVTVGSPLETVFESGRAIITAATAGATITTTTLEVAGGGSVSLGSNILSATVVTLDAPTSLAASFSSTNTTIEGSAGADTITLGNPGGFYALDAVVTGGGGGDTFVITGGTGDNADFRDTAADLNGSTIDGFNFAPSTAVFESGNGDFIDVTDFLYSSAETAVYAAGTLTISNAAGTAHTEIAIPGAPAGGGFVLSSDGSNGTLASYIPQLFTLTAGADSVVGTTTNLIEATDATLSSGDSIDGGVTDIYTTPFQSTLDLLGAGTFDMSLPSALTGLSAIVGDSTGSATGGSTGINQTIRLRNGLNTGVTLGPGHDIVYGAMNSAAITSAAENLGTAGDDIFLGDARESVELFGQSGDVIHVTAATGLASVADNFEGTLLLTGTEEVDGGGLVPIGGSGNIGTLELAAATHMLELGTAPPLVVGSTGTDTIDMTNSGAGGFGGLVTVEPNGGGDTLVAPINDQLLVLGTQAQLNNTTIDGFNFLPAQSGKFGLLTGTTIDISDLAYVSGVVTTSFAGGTLSVLNGASLVDTFVLPLGGAGSFTPAKDGGGTGTALTFTASGAGTLENTTLAAGATLFEGSAGNDTLTVPQGVLAAGQTLDGQGGDNVLALSGTGDFDLNLPSVLANFTVLQPGTGETITLRAATPVQIGGGNGADYLLPANTANAIVLTTGTAGDSVALNSAGDIFIDNPFGGATITVSAASIGASIDGASFAKDTLDIVGGGGMVMGSNIRDIAAVNLTESGAILFANGIAGLAINLTGTASAAGAAPDTVIAGGDGDTITEGSTGGNIFGAGAGDDSFIFQPYLGSAEATVFPQGDTLYNFAVSGNDQILLPGGVVPASGVTFSGGTLHVGGTGAGDSINLVMVGNYSGSFSATLDPTTNDTVVTFTGTATSAGPAPCFAAGTRIMTVAGEVAVEDLRAGDRVPTLLGEGPARIVWIGHRRVAPRRHARPLDVQPVRVRASAFGPGRPHRDLVLSPDHAVYLDGALVPARLLVDGTSVERLDVEAVTYWHVELARHDVVFAEGLPCETYLDTGNRDAFDGGARVRRHATLAGALREGYGCAPLVLDGSRERNG